MRRVRYVRHAWTKRIGRLLTIFLLTMVGALLLAAPVRADGDTVALSITNGTTFTYGGTQPMFTAVVTFGTPPTPINFWTISVQLEDGESFGATNSSGPPPGQNPATVTFTGIRPSNSVVGGQHTAVASFHNPETGTTVQSNPVNFIVNKANSSLSCDIYQGGAHLLGLGLTLQIEMAPSGQTPVDWQHGAYTVALDGPTHIEASNLIPDSNDMVTLAGPTQIGDYTLSCAFNGTASFNPSSYTDSFAYTFSKLHSLGTVQLFTNPTTLAAGKYLDFYVVFHAAPGLPTPTGEVHFGMGGYYSNNFQLSSAGNLLVHFNPLPALNGVTNIMVGYDGDKNYNFAGITFPLTNPPIPSGVDSGGSGSGGSLGNNPQGTATAQGTPSTTATVESDTTPTVAVAGNVAPTTHPSSGANSGLWLIVILALVGLIIIGGAVGAGVFLIRQARVSADLERDRPRGFYVPPSYVPPHDGTWPPLYEDR